MIILASELEPMQHHSLTCTQIIMIHGQIMQPGLTQLTHLMVVKFQGE